MRRVLANLLVLLFSGMLLAPAAAGLGTVAPNCCRRAGAHHCMGAAGQAAPGDGFRDALRNCPFSSATLLPNSLRPQMPAAVPAPRLSRALRAEPERIQPAAPVAGSQSPRAPPTLSSL